MKTSEQVRKAGNSFKNAGEDDAANHLWKLADEIVQLEQALDKRLKQEYMDEDHRLGGTGRTFDEFRKAVLDEFE